MKAIDAVRAGDLQGALKLLQDAVRDNPADSKLRVFLFQLFCVLGNWQRALTQLNVVAEMDAGTLPMAQAYREAIGCEALRTAIFAGKHTPLLFGEPEEWLAWLIQSLALHADGRAKESNELRRRALEQAPATSGTIQVGDAAPVEFTWIADADSRLGPVLEALVNGRYYWVPFHRIRRIDIEPPEDLRDMVWMPTHFVWANGGEMVGLIPTRYAGSEQVEDSAVRLSRKTEWQDMGDDFCSGRGQRMLATDVSDYALMDVRRIELNPVVPSNVSGADSSVPQ